VLLGTVWRGLCFLFRLHHLPLLFCQQVAQMVELAGAFELLAPVHHDLFSVHIAGLVAHQERRQVGQFLVCAQSSAEERD